MNRNYIAREFGAGNRFIENGRATRTCLLRSYGCSTLSGPRRDGSALFKKNEEEKPCPRHVLRWGTHPVAGCEAGSVGSARSPLYPPWNELPSEWPIQEDVRNLLPAYAQQGLILDQGSDGACTGLRPRGRHQLPALHSQPQGRRYACQHSERGHALPARQALRGAAGRGLRRVELPWRAQGLASARRLLQCAVALQARQEGQAASRGA